MAVEDKFVNALLAAGKKAPPVAGSGASLLFVGGTFEIAAADSDLSVYRLARLPANAIPVKFDLFSDAAVDATDVDAGLYKPGVGGAVVDKDLLADGISLGAGAAITVGGANAGLTNLGGADPLAAYGKTLWELLGLSAPNRQDYDLALTANTAGGAAGTVSWGFWYALG